VGRLVSERLGFRYLDEEIVARAAEKAGLTPADVADAERRRSTIRRLLESLAEGGSPETYAFGGFVAGTGSDDLRSVIREAIDESAAAGDVVIVAHAASFALAKQPSILRVFVTASADTRARRVADSGVDARDAAKAVKDSDAARADYLRRFHEVDEESPIHYDLVVTTDVLSVEDAAEIVAAAASL
jgi:hypothetical protein